MDPIEDRIAKAKLPRLRDLFSYNAVRAESEASLADRRYEYLIEQRDKLNERIRFGILTLNAASLVALASLVGDEKKVKALGLGSTSIGFAALMFGIGLATAALSIWSNSNYAIHAPASAYEILMSAEHKRAYLEHTCSERSEDEYGRILDEKPNKSPDFAFSKLTIWLTNSAGSFWLSGLLFIICKVAGANLALQFCS